MTQAPLPVRRCAAVLAMAGALAGCSTSARTPDRAAADMSGPSVAPVREPAKPTSTAAQGPSPAAVMACGTEVRTDVRALFHLPKQPSPTASWRHGIYRCRYVLQEGPLTIAVSEDGTRRAALARLAAARQHAAKPRTITGLASFGLPAFETADGVVMFAKDDKTLTVDARGLPTQVTPERQPRGNAAYQIASDILGCWNE